jgi:hypothetical protein
MNVQLEGDNIPPDAIESGCMALCTAVMERMNELD